MFQLMMHCSCLGDDARDKRPGAWICPTAHQVRQQPGAVGRKGGVRRHGAWCGSLALLLICLVCFAVKNTSMSNECGQQRAEQVAVMTQASRPQRPGQASTRSLRYAKGTKGAGTATHARWGFYSIRRGVLIGCRQWYTLRSGNVMGHVETPQVSNTGNPAILVFNGTLFLSRRRRYSVVDEARCRCPPPPS